MGDKKLKTSECQTGLKSGLKKAKTGIKEGQEIIAIIRG